MNRYFYIIIFCTISYGRGISVFGGLNYSHFANEKDWFEDCNSCEWVYDPGASIGLEANIWLFKLGLGFNGRYITFKNDPKRPYHSKRSWNLDYLTFHTTIPISITNNFTVFGGSQGGLILSSSKYKVDYFDNTLHEDREQKVWEDGVDQDYGLLLGAQYWFTNKVGLRTSYYHGLKELYGNAEQYIQTSSISLIFSFTGKKSSSTTFAGPSAQSGSGSKGAIKKPGPTGSSEIDDFVNSAFELNDNLLALKAKLDGISTGLIESNDIISEIDNHPDGTVGWVSNQLAKGTSKAVNNLKTLNISSGLDGLNPTQKLRNVLQTLKSGVVDGSDKLKTIPNDLESLANDAKNLISSASSLPQAAKSLGFKAPKALAAIKDASSMLKNIPGEVSSVGDSAKEVAKEIEQFMQNIENLLNG